jgi:uncharacterized protein (DUF1778 family)
MTNPAARLDLRLSARDKDRIARAAALRGLPVSAFVRAAVLREADAVVADESTIMLSAQEARRLVAALGKPFKPSVRLKLAMERGLAVTLPTQPGGPALVVGRARGRTDSLAARLRGRATASMSTEDILRLTRGT